MSTRPLIMRNIKLLQRHEDQHVFITVVHTPGYFNYGVKGSDCLRTIKVLGIRRQQVSTLQYKFYIIPFFHHNGQAHCLVFSMRKNEEDKEEDTSQANPCWRSYHVSKNCYMGRTLLKFQYLGAVSYIYKAPFHCGFSWWTKTQTAEGNIQPHGQPKN